MKNAIDASDSYKFVSEVLGKGNSTELFMDIIEKKDFWNTEIQKRFVDIDM